LAALVYTWNEAAEIFTQSASFFQGVCGSESYAHMIYNVQSKNKFSFQFDLPFVG